MIIYLFVVPLKNQTLYGQIVARNKDQARQLLRLICKIKALPKHTVVERR